MTFARCCGTACFLENDLIPNVSQNFLPISSSVVKPGLEQCQLSSRTTDQQTVLIQKGRLEHERFREHRQFFALQTLPESPQPPSQQGSDGGHSASGCLLKLSTRHNIAQDLENATETRFESILWS